MAVNGPEPYAVQPLTVTVEAPSCVERSQTGGSKVTPLELQRIYLKTLVSIEDFGSLVPIGESSMARGSVVHVLTAWNPGDDRPSRADNDAANEELRAQLVEKGLAPVRAIGADPDSDHFEESWAVVGLDENEARAIGASFGQVAVFRIADGMQTALACTEGWSVSRTL